MIRVDDKRDRQTSGVIVFKSIGKEDAFAHPLTSVPLTVATSERELRYKRFLRNFNQRGPVRGVGKKWQEFLRGEKKEQLIELIWKYFEGR